MMDQTEIETSIEAYEPFRHIIATIKIRCRAFAYAVTALVSAWSIRFEPQPAEHHHYPETEGSFGFAERVIPPRFELSPFFSETA